MPLFLGHRTAELLLDKLDEVPDLALGQELEHCCAGVGDFASVDLEILEGIQQPYDVLVSSPHEIRRWDGIRCHLCTASLPSNSFFELSSDVFVASPALCLVQRAQSLTLAQSVALGERLCGTFALDKRKRSGIRRRPPLVTLEDLRSFVDCCEGVRGIRRARRAVDLILENSASPMETISRLVFCLPRRLHGFGLPLPIMNYEKALSPSAMSIAGKGFIRIDLFWEDHDFGGEYQGKYSHSSHTDIGKDIARQLAAERMGIELQMITIEQLRDPAQRLFIARKIADRLGADIPTDQKFLSLNQQLVNELLQAAIA